MSIRPTSRTEPEPSRAGQLQPAVPSHAPAVALGDDRLHLSVGEKLLRGNRLALADGGRSVLGFLHHPLHATLGYVGSLAGMVLHPLRALAGVRDAFRRNPLDGVFQAVTLGSAWAGLASGLALAGAFALAIPTGGASLALLPAAGAIASWAGLAGMGVLGAGFIKDQVSLGRARTQGELTQAASALSADELNMAAAAAMVGVGKGARSVGSRLKPKNVNPASGQRVAARLLGRAELKAHRPGGEGRGVSAEGLSRDAFRERAAQEMNNALDWSAQGARQAQLTDLDQSEFTGLQNLGERRMVFHGTSGNLKAAIRNGGLRPSDMGDYGAGVYVGSSARIGVTYADDVVMRRGLQSSGGTVVYVAEMAPGKVLDLETQQADFLRWARERFDPNDPADPVNQPYMRHSASISPFADNTWFRFLPRYCAEKGYDSVLIRDWDGLGQDYWVVHDPRRVIVRQEANFDPPRSVQVVPDAMDGKLAAAINDGRQPPTRRQKP